MTRLCRHRGEAELYLQPIHNHDTRRGWLKRQGHAHFNLGLNIMRLVQYIQLMFIEPCLEIYTVQQKSSI